MQKFGNRLVNFFTYQVGQISVQDKKTRKGEAVYTTITMGQIQFSILGII